jgi:hypothetical protein
MDLNASSAAEAIERAFAANRLDVSVAGDWEMVRAKLGVEGLGLEMPKNPHNFHPITQLAGQPDGFVRLPVFGDGDLDEDAAEMYYEAAMNAFAVSPEGIEAREHFGGLGWALTFLELGVSHLGVTAKDMSVRDAKEILFDLIPCKISTEPGSARAIVFELRQFWSYVHRQFQLPHAAEIAALCDEAAADALEAELSDETNFGMAKSLVMAGLRAGFDMSTHDGMEEFIMAFNSSLSHRRQGASIKPPAPPKLTADEKRAFNKQRQKKLAATRKGTKRR